MRSMYSGSRYLIRSSTSKAAGQKKRDRNGTLFYKGNSEAGKVDEQVEGIAAKSSDPSLIPGTYMAKGELTPTAVL